MPQQQYPQQGYGPMRTMQPQFPSQNLDYSMQSDGAGFISDQPFIQGRPVRQPNQQMRGGSRRPKRGMDKLRNHPAVFVKQKFEMLEALTGCETENRYKVYGSNENMDKVGDPIFKCKEKSSFLARNCLR